MEGHRENTFIHEGPRRTTKNTFYPRRDAKGREEHLFIHEGPRRATKNTFYPRRDAKNTFLSTKGHEGPLRTPFFGRDGLPMARSGWVRVRGHPRGVPLRELKGAIGIGIIWPQAVDVRKWG